jgi:hypothetical protein
LPYKFLNRICLAGFPGVRLIFYWRLPGVPLSMPASFNLRGIGKQPSARQMDTID